MINFCRYFILKAISLIVVAIFVPLFIFFIAAALPLILVVTVHNKMNDIVWRMKNNAS
tara:strand:+ start:103 stop:276 length:174 start_codon:yes stop_codon:yes gene_type:complete